MAKSDKYPYWREPLSPEAWQERWANRKKDREYNLPDKEWLDDPSPEHMLSGHCFVRGLKHNCGVRGCPSNCL